MTSSNLKDHRSWERKQDKIEKRAARREPKSCPNCSHPMGPAEPLCHTCWTELPVEDQQMLAYVYNDKPQTYAYCLAQAVEHMRQRSEAATARRKAGAARHLARKSGGTDG